MERSGNSSKSPVRMQDLNDVDKTLNSIEISKLVVQKLHLDPIEPIEYSTGGDHREGADD